MKTYNKKETHIDNSIPDDLQSVWNLSGEITQKPIVNEQETERALDSIWNTIDDKVESKKTYTIRYLVAAVALITAAVSFLNFFSIQKNALPGEISVIELRDGTNITLMGNSNIEYPLLFGITNRDIKLDGHAYFDVASNKKLPFIVSSPSLETQVLGTIFEIEDWEDNESFKSSVLVHEGIVEVKNETEGIVLYEGDEVTLIESKLSKTHSDNHNKKHMVNWEEERVNFKNISLKNLFKRLSLQFNTTIEISTHIDEEERVSGSYRFDTSIEEILIDVAMVKNFSFKKTNNGYIIQ